MKDWIILPKGLIQEHPKLFQKLLENKDYSVFFTDDLDFFEDKETGTVILLSGYILPGINHSAHGDLPSILSDYRKFGDDFISYFKGIFTLVIIEPESIKIFSDQLGIDRFFYHVKDNRLIASSNIEILSRYVNLEISLTNVYQYFVFNYFIEGITIYKDVFHCPGGMMVSVTGSDVNFTNYFNLLEILQTGKKLNEKETFKSAPELWTEIIKQYYNKFAHTHVSQTLTAGLDSRLILAGLRHIQYDPLTFTFGNSNSMDVVHAKKIADKLNLKHLHLYPDNDFFANFAGHASGIIRAGNGLETIYRSHRLASYAQLPDENKAIFFGFAGSEIIRGLYPDRLLIPDFIIRLWTDKNFDIKDFIQDFLIQNSIEPDEKSLYELVKRIESLNYLSSPSQYLFNVMIPMHFGQDVRLLAGLGIFSLLPYCDLDYIKFQAQTPYFTDDSRKESYARLGNFSRRKGPYFSSKLISVIDKENAKLSLGKGYSPYEYSRSLVYSGLKFLYYKKFIRSHQGPNFVYENWYKEFLTGFITDKDIAYLGFNKELVLNKLQKVDGTDEFSFLPFTKLTNILMTTEWLG